MPEVVQCPHCQKMCELEMTVDVSASLKKPGTAAVQTDTRRVLLPRLPASDDGPEEAEDFPEPDSPWSPGVRLMQKAAAGCIDVQDSVQDSATAAAAPSRPRLTAEGRPVELSSAGTITVRPTTTDFDPFFYGEDFHRMADSMADDMGDLDITGDKKGASGSDEPSAKRSKN